MKTLDVIIRVVLFLMLVVVLTSCNNTNRDAGTLTKVNPVGDSEIDVYKYYYEDGCYVYISRFKDNPNVVNTTWLEKQGKSTVTKSNTVIYENDSIQVTLKR